MGWLHSLLMNQIISGDILSDLMYVSVFSLKNSKVVETGDKALPSKSTSMVTETAGFGLIFEIEACLLVYYSLTSRLVYSLIV